MIENTCHRKKFSTAKLKTIFNYTFQIFVEDPFDIWTSLKMVLTPLHINRYRLYKVTFPYYICRRSFWYMDIVKNCFNAVTH
jgi:hypothetical protein